MKKKVNLYDYLTDASAYIKNLQALARERDWAANYVDPASVKVYHVKENYSTSPNDAIWGLREFMDKHKGQQIYVAGTRASIGNFEKSAKTKDDFLKILAMGTPR